MAKGCKIERWHGLEKLTLEVGSHTCVECELFLVGQELAIDLGDDGAGGTIPMVRGSSRVDGRIEGYAIGLNLVLGGRDCERKMAEFAVSSNGGDGPALDWISACKRCRERKVGLVSARTVSSVWGNVVETFSVMIGTRR